MKLTVRLLFLLISGLCCMSAQAVVDPYTVMEITPAEGDVTSLQNFTITFGGLPVTVNENAIPTLDKGANMTQAGHMRTDDDGTTVIVEFPDCWTASGQYYLNLPEGSIVVNGQTLLPLTLRYNIKGTIDEFYSQITINPAEGEVTGLKDFNIYFPLYVGGIAPNSAATLTNLTTKQTYHGEMQDRGFGVMVNFSDLVEEPGRYRLTIPEVIGGWDGWQPDKRIPTWFMCGDSTMAVYPEDRAPMTGWGQALQSLVPNGVFIQDEAVNGRSSKSFIDERRLENIDACLRPGDRLIVSFSHNDEKSDPLRYTSPEETFPAYLTRYLETARRHGAEPILATPICRRNFVEDGSLVFTHGAYPQAIRDLAGREGVWMVDLEKATAALLRREGAEGTPRLFCHVPAGSPNYPDGLKDNSHLQVAGAVAVAQRFLQGLAGQGDWDDEPLEGESAPQRFESLINQEDHVVQS